MCCAIHPSGCTLKQVLDSGVLGEIITVEHRENVAYWHMAHSFVRGNWRNSGESSPMILAKCCHDMDILYWNLAGRCERLSSFGSLLHYRSESVGPEIPPALHRRLPHRRGMPLLGHRHLHGLSSVRTSAHRSPSRAKSIPPGP